MRMGGGGVSARCWSLKRKRRREKKGGEGGEGGGGKDEGI
jgi:hypothetical protein